MINFLRKITPRPLLLFYHKCWAILGNVIYRFPGRKIKVIGVTGTNGKTTTCNMIAKILTDAGKKVGLSSTVNFQIGDKKWVNESKLTVLGRFGLPKILRQMVDASCEFAVLEVSSHAITQNRIWGIPFDAAVFTNLTHDHLDYHKDLKDYRNTKGRLFANLSKSLKKDMPKILIVNADDPESAYFASFNANKKQAYTISDKDIGLPKISAKNIKIENFGSHFEVETPREKFNLNLKIPGKFNISNALAAYSLTEALGIKQNIIKKSLEKFEGVPGRMEFINEGQGFFVVVDYAHTPDALEKIYQTLKPQTSGKIISVLGATGDRDKTKRPILGELAGKYADYVIVTDEDPYSENPESIMDQVIEGVVKTGKIEKKDFWKILDREKAIKFAIKLASDNDCVIITGKGCERVMVTNQGKISWDDKQIVRQALKKRKINGN